MIKDHVIIFVLCVIVGIGGGVLARKYLKAKDYIAVLLLTSDEGLRVRHYPLTVDKLDAQEFNNILVALTQQFTNNNVVILNLIPLAK